MRNECVMKIDVGLVLETVEGALIYLTYQGRFVASLRVMARSNAGEELSPDEYSLAVTTKYVGLDFHPENVGNTIESFAD